MLLRLKKVKKYFPVKKGVMRKVCHYVKAVDNIDLEINEGENLGLVGESGSGKTTLGRAIIRLYPVDSGNIYFKGEDITNLSQRKLKPLRKGFQMVFQDPYSSLDPRFTIRNIIREAMSLETNTSRSEQDSRIVDMLKAVGLKSDVLNRYPHEFSGGERQRIAIARALVMNPELLVLDEAVSSLDVLIQEQIIDLLKELQKKFKVTYLFITHNLRIVKKLSHKIAVMYRGKIVELGESGEIFDNPLHPYTKELLSAAIEYKSEHHEFVDSFSDSCSLIDTGNGHFVIK